MTRFHSIVEPEWTLNERQSPEKNQNTQLINVKTLELFTVTWAKKKEFLLSCWLYRPR